MYPQACNPPLFPPQQQQDVRNFNTYQQQQSQQQRVVPAMSAASPAVAARPPPRPGGDYGAVTETTDGWVYKKELGSGGFGCVRLWTNKDTGKSLALKRCRYGQELKDKARDRWCTECEIMLKLNHRNVVRAFKVPESLESAEDALPALAMEYCSEGDLRRVLRRPENCCGLREFEIRMILHDIGSAIEYLHSNKIIHRDLKPENIVLQEGEERIVYKLTDLGYAKDLDQGSVCHSFVGTMQYLAPELFRHSSYTATVDYWSFGTTMFECTVGYRPFLHSIQPGRWPEQIFKKKNEDIHAYIKPPGNAITFTRHFPEPNYLCRYTALCLEQWMRLMLIFDPKTRGGKLLANGHTECFERLHTIIETKILCVLCVPTGKLHHYPIHPSSKSLQEIMTLIHKDTHIEVRDQEILLASGLVADPIKPATQCLVDKPSEEESIVYLFRKDEKIFDQNQRNWRELPDLVQQMRKDACKIMVHDEQVKSWSHAVYYCRQLCKDYYQLIDAQRAAMLCLIRCHDRFGLLRSEMENGLQNLKAKHEFYSESFGFDKVKYEEQRSDGIFSKQMHSQWLKMTDELNLEKLNADITELNQHCVALSTRFRELHHSPLAQPQHKTLLDNTTSEAVSQYERLMKMKREERRHPSDQAAMVKCIVTSIEQYRSRTKDLYTHLGKIATSKQEMLGLIPRMDHKIKIISSTSKQLADSQRRRQKDVWMLVSIALKQGAQRKSKDKESLAHGSLSPPPGLINNESTCSEPNSDSFSTTLLPSGETLKESLLSKCAEYSSLSCQENDEIQRRLQSTWHTLHDVKTLSPSHEMDWNFMQSSLYPYEQGETTLQSDNISEGNYVTQLREPPPALHELHPSPETWIPDDIPSASPPVIPFQSDYIHLHGEPSPQSNLDATEAVADFNHSADLIHFSDSYGTLVASDLQNVQYTDTTIDIHNVTGAQVVGPTRTPSSPGNEITMATSDAELSVAPQQDSSESTS